MIEKARLIRAFFIRAVCVRVARLVLTFVLSNLVTSVWIALNHATLDKMRDMKINDQSIVLVMTNCPDKTVAQTIAKSILKKNLAACVNIMPEMMSLYTWNGKEEVAAEVQLLIKTTAHVYPELQTLICSLHPYQTPEIIAIPVVDGLPSYLQWVHEQTGLE
ncbi:divalent-cation tolerance protein CutA [Undibacterium sp. WLX3042]|uniref:divalent-cation tolerance protein CutA n=1 Tax=Undibacterium sp. WLX3042 TaxID=3412686 RepID=UPI003C2EF0AC